MTWRALCLAPYHACECLTTLLAYLLIEAPENSERYGGVMETLMLLSLGMQVIAQFGAYFDDFLAYMDMAGASTRPLLS